MVLHYVVGSRSAEIRTDLRFETYTGSRPLRELITGTGTTVLNFVRRLPVRCRLRSSSSSSVVGQFQLLHCRAPVHVSSIVRFLLPDQDCGTVSHTRLYVSLICHLTVFTGKLRRLLSFEAPALIVTIAFRRCV